MATSNGDPVIYLIGTSGHPNYGDELITAAWLRQLATTHPQAEVWVDSPRPGQSAVLHGHLHARARFVDTLYHACWNAPSEDPGQVFQYAAEVIDNPGLIPREATGVEDLSRVDVVHIMGGSYISVPWPRHLTLIAAAAAIKTRFGARTAITGTTLTPLVDGSVELVGKTLSTFDVVDVRDRSTQEIMAPFVGHLTCTNDDAFLLDIADEHDRTFPHRTLINVQNDFLTVPLAEVADFVVAMLREWGVIDAPVAVVESMPPDDTAIMPLLAPHVAQLSVVPFSSIWRHGLPAAPRSRWITTRFHTHLMGAASGAWGVVLPVGGDSSMVDPQTLIEAGSGWAQAPDLDTIVPPSRRVTTPYDGALPKLRATKLAVAQHIAALVGG